MYTWWRRHPRGVDIMLLAQGEELVPEQERRIREHLAACPKCRSEYKVHLYMNRELMRAPLPWAPVEELMERFWAKLEEEDAKMVAACRPASPLTLLS